VEERKTPESERRDVEADFCKSENLSLIKRPRFGAKRKYSQSENLPEAAEAVEASQEFPMV
jgi:hypothetical protein